MKTKVAKATMVGGVALAALGLGAGVASADPGHDDRGRGSVPEQQYQERQGQDQQRQEQQRGDQHQQPSPHGFWIFGQWIPLP
nr:hypothetical protein [Nocardia noduli]